MPPTVGDNAIPAFRFYQSVQPRFPLEALSEAASALNADNLDIEDNVAETTSADIGDCDLWVPEDEEEDEENEEEDEENESKMLFNSNMNRILLLLFIVRIVSSKLEIIENTDELTSCVSTVSRLIFDEGNTIYFISDNDNLQIFPKSYGYINININKSILNLKQLYGQNFIIHVEDASLNDTINQMTSSSIWYQRRSPKGRFIIVTTQTNIQQLFVTLWDHILINAVVVLHQKGTNATILMSNPHAPGNKCGTYVENYYSEKCEKVKIISFLKPFRSFNGCTLEILTIKNVFNLPGNYFQRLIKIMENKLNVTTKPMRDVNNLLTSKLFLFLFYNYALHNVFERGINMLALNVMWIVPVADEKSALKALTSIFQLDLWLFVLGSFTVIVIFWTLVVKCYNKSIDFSGIFLKVYHMTLMGSLHQIPKYTTLKYIFLTYIVYAVHIQSIYTSNLVRILTIAQYEKQISNIYDLADSDLPIYTINEVIQFSFKKNVNYEREVSEKIFKRLITITSAQEADIIVQISNFRNCAVLTFSPAWPKKPINVKRFINNSFTEIPEIGFRVRHGHYIMDTVNSLYQTIVESGLYHKFMKELFSKKIEPDDSHSVVITLEHYNECVFLIKYFVANAYNCVIKMLLFPLLVLFGKCVDSEKIPESVNSLTAFQMSPTVLFLKWNKPVSNLYLVNYDIQCSEIQNDYVDSEEFLVGVDGNQTQARLPSLNPSGGYRIYVYSIFTNIASRAVTMDVTLKGVGNYLPAVPDFIVKLNPSKTSVIVTWTPNSDFPGDSFYVSYKKSNEPHYVNTKMEHTSFYKVVENLEKDSLYLFYITACYGNGKTTSKIKQIYT
ncbi:hypothetical protein FQA39_LY13490 [Lamprigera yunnana]|nr:hypothetical protein FQA39_LY13490 [Lamprigera yunnana]